MPGLVEQCTLGYEHVLWLQLGKTQARALGDTLVFVFLVDVWIPCALPGRGSPVSRKDEGWMLTPAWDHGGLLGDSWGPVGRSLPDPLASVLSLWGMRVMLWELDILDR